MKITRELIMDNRTIRGAWTMAQLSAIGIKWPPEKGWIEKAIGRDINDEQRRAFIDGAKKRVRPKP